MKSFKENYNLYLGTVCLIITFMCLTACLTAQDIAPPILYQKDDTLYHQGSILKLAYNDDIYAYHSTSGGACNVVTKHTVILSGMRVFIAYEDALTEFTLTDNIDIYHDSDGNEYKYWLAHCDTWDVDVIFVLQQDILQVSFNDDTQTHMYLSKVPIECKTKPTNLVGTKRI